MKRPRVSPCVFIFFAVFALICNGQITDVAPPTGNANFQKKEFTAKDGGKLSYWLMTPAAVEPGKKYPLVLALHGRGGNTDAAGTLGSDELRTKYPCFVMAPAVSRAETWAVPAAAGSRGKPMLPVALEALENLKTDLPIDANRVYVTGQSMGGYGTFGALAASPQTFAAAMPICGGWDAADAAKMKDVPIWVFHGDADATVPIERSRTM